MNPLGIMIAFVLFGFVIGVGGLLVATSLTALYHRRALHIAAVHTAGAYSLRDVAGLMTRGVLLLAGLAMMYQGALWIYIVVFR